ncbi:MAG TPA: ATP-binding protein [Cytophagales bacterium]|nr:ATP-binding protein [Cytophagales bacterium]
MENFYKYLENHLVSSLSEDELDTMRMYFSFYEKRENDINEWMERDLKDHPVFGLLLRNMPKNSLEKIRRTAIELQYNAIFNNDWQPYIESQVNLGKNYARQGVEFYMWYELITLLRNYIMDVLSADESRKQSEILAIIRGMNRYFDIIMCVISEAYLNEKKSIIEEQKGQQEKLNKELKHTMASLKEKNEDLEQFAYIASHDLQEPLRMVTSFLTQLEKKYKEQLDDRAKQYIHFAVDGAVRMRRIILDLLEYSRVGRKEYELEAVDVNKLVEEVVQLNQTLRKEKQAKIEWKNLPTINVARTPFQQVFQNLIGNALKYQKAGETPFVEISAIETKDHWQFAVADNGIGIEPQFYDKIFAIFQRLHNKDEYSGTGIGLAICKKIIEGHHGKIWVESVAGQGSVFYFTVKK